MKARKDKSVGDISSAINITIGPDGTIASGRNRVATDVAIPGTNGGAGPSFHLNTVTGLAPIYTNSDPNALVEIIAESQLLCAVAGTLATFNLSLITPNGTGLGPYPLAVPGSFFPASFEVKALQTFLITMNLAKSAIGSGNWTVGATLTPNAGSNFSLLSSTLRCLIAVSG